METVIAHLFLGAVPFAIVALVYVLLIKEVPWRTTLADAADLTTKQTPRTSAAGPIQADTRGASVPVPTARLDPRVSS